MGESKEKYVGTCPISFIYQYQKTKKGIRKTKCGAIWKNTDKEGGTYLAVKFDNLRVIINPNPNYKKPQEKEQTNDVQTQAQK